MGKSTRPPRFSQWTRGTIFGVLIAVYSWVMHLPQASFTMGLLIAAGLQLLVMALRRLVPPEQLPQAMEIFELLVDSATVLMFALSVYGGIIHLPAEV
jgi:hypothetical protein